MKDRESGFRIRRTTQSVICALAVTAGLAVGGFASVQPAELEIHVTPAGLSWLPVAGHQGASLVVAGSEGRLFERRFEATETIAFPLIGDHGVPLADGRYRWELRLEKILPPALEEVLSEAAAAEDLEIYRSLARSVGGLIARFSGRFRVEQGSVVLPVVRREAAQTSEGYPEESASGSEGFQPGGAEAAINPTNEVKISGASPQLVFDETGTGSRDFAIEADAGELNTFSGSTAGTRIVGLDADASADSIFVVPGSVGLFTSTPAGPDIELHILSDADGVPEIRLEDVGGQKWDLRVVQDDLQIQDTTALFPPTGGILEIDKVGSLYELIFRGDATIIGDVAMGSSRESKTDIVAAGADEILAAVEELPLFFWSYKKDPEGVRHFGPMAEDFHQRFGLGRGPLHISPGDSAGLALAAVQALARQQSEKDAEIELLRARIVELETMMAAAAAAVTPTAQPSQEP